MKVIVLGGAGYIGSHICKKLHQNGIDFLIIDNLSTGNEKLIKWGDFIKENILNTDKITDIFAKYKPDAIIHLAAFSSVGESVENPILYYQNNVTGSISVINAMIKAKINNIVFSSSAAIFGAPKDEIISETTLKLPINPYGKSKLMIEEILQDCSKKYDICHTSLRYFNACGADPEGEIGEIHEPETHLIPILIKNFLNNNASSKIFGNDYPTPDGTCIRDYIHVCDIANAHLLALKKMLNTKKSIQLNLGTKTGTSTKEIVDTVSKICEQPLNIKITNKRAGDPFKLVCDNSLAKSYLGWQAQYSVQDAIKHAFSWHKQNG